MAAHMLEPPNNWRHPNWYCGITARNQKQLDQHMRHLARIPNPKWLSAEPMGGPLNLRRHLQNLDGVVVGTDNRRKATRTEPAWIREIISQCGRAAVPVFIKQIRASAGALLVDADRFPEDMRIRELAWPCAGNPGGWDHNRGSRKPHPPQPYLPGQEITDAADKLRKEP